MLNLLNIGGNLEIIGSGKDKLVLYPGDIDLQEYIIIKKSSYLTGYRELKRILYSLRFDKNVFLLDIKAGHDNINSLHWTYKEFVEEKQKMYSSSPRRYIQVEDIFSQKSIIKLDLLYVDEENIFSEYSVNYYFEIEKDASENPKTYYVFTEQELRNSFLLDIEKLEDDGKNYKSLKRKYSYYKLIGGHKNELQKILRIFNSPLGKLYQQASKIDLIKSILDNKTGLGKPSKSLILFNIKYVINQTPEKYKYLLRPLMEGLKNENYKTIYGILLDVHDDIMIEIEETTLKLIEGEKI